MLCKDPVEQQEESKSDDETAPDSQDAGADGSDSDTDQVDNVFVQDVCGLRLLQFCVVP